VRSRNPLRGRTLLTFEIALHDEMELDFDAHTRSETTTVLFVPAFETASSPSGPDGSLR